MGQAVRRGDAADRGRTRTRALVLLIALGAAAAQSAPVRLEQGRFVIVAERPDSLLASTLLADAVARDLFPGLPRSSSPILIQIAPNRRAFAELAGAGAPEWGGAFAFPLERRVVLQGRSAPSSAGEPRQTLRHELAHLALHEHLGTLPPRWFSEGYASYAAGEWNREEVIAANLGLAMGGLGSLAGLDTSFALGTRRVEAAYALSYRAVAELAALDSREGLGPFFAVWIEERDLDRALRRRYGLTLEGFERLWLTRTRRRYGGLALFADLSIGALVLLVVILPLFVLRRRRDRERLARMRAADAAAEERERQSALEELLRSLPLPPGGSAQDSAPSS